mmetsp:Transcript_47165/g.109050  ORF Transcript_47165/g.109050 Transcript_47165/m.109050 type:complete len:223 (-) Transcript_47165:337-1005(-)
MPTALSGRLLAWIHEVSKLRTQVNDPGSGHTREGLVAKVQDLDTTRRPPEPVDMLDARAVQRSYRLHGDDDVLRSETPRLSVLTTWDNPRRTAGRRPPRAEDIPPVRELDAQAAHPLRQLEGRLDLLGMVQATPGKGMLEEVLCQAPEEAPADGKARMHQRIRRLLAVGVQDRADLVSERTAKTDSAERIIPMEQCAQVDHVDHSRWLEEDKPSLTISKASL